MQSVLTAEKPTRVVTVAPTAAPLQKPARLASLDAYRGFIMVAMASSGLSIPKVAKAFPGNPLWEFLAFHTDHVPWVGCGFWDLIQPAFMFMVGVAIPYSHAGRKAKGDSETKIWLHNGLRAVLLVLLGVFLSSNWSEQTNWSFVNVLSQIGLGYVFVCLLRGLGFRVQLAALATTLAGYWLWFALWPVPPSGLDHAVGLPATTHHLSGFFAHWDRCTNPAAAFDAWFLNLFPRGKPFVANEEGYVTLNFIPSMGTMILGLMAGELLRGPKSGLAKFGALVAAGSACLLLGCLAGWTVCPVVKKIWTPSWTLYSGGWVLWLLAAFYGLLDLRGWKGWFFPFTVVGMNSIAIYCMSQLLRPWIKNTFHIHIVTPLQGRLGTAWWDGTYGPMVQCAVILAVLWLACWWMYRRGIFLRI